MRITSSTLSMTAQTERVQTSQTRIEGSYFVDRAGGRDTVRISSEAERQSALRAVVSASVGRGAGLREAGGGTGADDLRDWLALSRERSQGAPISGTRRRGPSNATAAGAGAQPSPVGSNQCGDSGKGESICTVSDDQLLGAPGGAKLVMLRRLVEALTGTRIAIVRSSDLGHGSTKVDTSPASQPIGTARTEEPARAGFGLELQIERVTSHSESVSFTAEGTLVTGDGRTLSFDFSLAASKTHLSVERLDVRMGDAPLKDPLVLMSTASFAELGERFKMIDLDRDGTLDRLPLVTNGAYLVLDRDGSGAIDDASELFGAITGDGFAELAELDLDRNGFIDEADPAFGDLRLLRGSEGGESLESLRDANVGAIATMSASTPLSLETNGVVAGRIRATGVYLTENGSVLPVEQVDVKA